jgi:hypothetical protein
MKIYLDGLERSGNVFLSYAISLTTGIEVVAVRTHMVDTLKEYKEDYPFVVPVRDALPSIASAKVYRDKVLNDNLYGVSENITQQLDYIINTYKTYIDFLLDNPKFFIAPFHEFTKDHNAVIDKLSKQYPSIQKYKNVTYKDIEEISSKMNDKIFDPEIGNLPRPNPKKEDVEKTLKSDFSEEISGIQSNIDKLYERYYNI